ncbi:hypothetical protein LFT45_22660 (plasmid) [Arthrobacter sp. FW305-BF8]|uniref:hypothetical protein n=1 Tax=Arthrobacter sp. FW305-BF8 TaxID=2879617 RepID=UPI001F3EF003|nr:hypothetical protein [Arthrobacter sp. FW305-BF8]UKA56681.1 hypothetical protein LFT45_22660 [Arthrobacter sp. FW305-BF8]
MGGFSGPVPDQMWAALRREFGLPSLEQVHARLSALPDVEPVLRSLVRVFIDDGTFCPGFQFTAGGQLDPRVTALFRAALEAKVPHNYFALWMMTPARELSWTRPVDRLDETSRLVRLLQAP